MRITALIVGLLLATIAEAGEWQVSDADSFGWRRALVVAEPDRLAVVCPPDQPPFAVPVAGGIDAERGRFPLALEVDGERHEETMTCSDVLCEASLDAETWRALLAGEAVTLWLDEHEGPTFPRDGSAAALAACSGYY